MSKKAIEIVDLTQEVEEDPSTTNKKRKAKEEEESVTTTKKQRTEKEGKEEKKTKKEKDITTKALELEASLTQWLRYQPLHHPSLDWFLEEYPPSSCRVPCGWISLDSPVAHNNGDFDQRQVPAMLLDWNTKTKASKKVTARDVDALAKKYHCRSGKWMLFRKAASIDSLWNIIALACGSGGLGVSAKVSTRWSARNGSYVVCVYVSDYFEVKEVKQVREALRNLGYTSKISFKADIYTWLGLDSKNKWGIPASQFYE